MKNSSDETKTSRKKTVKQLERSKKRKVNGWKISFLILVGLIVGSSAFLVFRITQVRETNLTKSTAVAEENGTPVLSIESNKEQINSLIDFFLEDFQKDSDIKYNFYLENEALLNGNFEVLGHPIEFYLYFEPYIMDNGNVQLKAKSLSLGTLSLPIKEILKFVQRDYKLPNWVEVDPDEKTVLLRLDQFKMKNGLFLRAEKINLVDDEIAMTVYLPNENTNEEKTSD